MEKNQVGMWPFDVSPFGIYRRFGVSQFWIQVNTDMDVSPFWLWPGCVAVLACRRFGCVAVLVVADLDVSPFWLSPIWMCRRFGCRRFGCVAVLVVASLDVSPFWLSPF